jgi:hypothetical protein
MDKPVEVSLDNLLQNSKNFDFLKEQGMQLIRQVASATWTDHNLHDPGITLLETLCHALTEAGLQSGAASAADGTEEDHAYIANLLTSGQKKAPQDFFTCSMVLPSSPVSLTDFQKVLLDHPLVEQAWVSVIDSSPKGHLSVLQRFSPKVNPIISSSVNVSGTDYDINFIFPKWTDPSSGPLQSDLLLQSLSFQNSLNPWRSITGTNSYSTVLTIQYALPESPSPSFTFQLPAILLLASPLVDIGDLPLVLQAASDLLTDVGDNSDSDTSILKQYNRRLVNSGDDSNNLNSNVLSTEVTASGSPYKIELAFPYWDERETALFRSDVTITDLVFSPDASNPWVPISGTDSYFTFLNFSADGSPVSWPVVLRIVGQSEGLASAIRNSILEAAATELITPSSNPALLKTYNEKVMMAFESSHRIRIYLNNYRNLCESFSAYRAVRTQEVAITCIIEMGSGTDIDSMLADIFYAVYQYISPQVVPQTLTDLLNQLPTDKIFEGPLLKHGFIPDSSLFDNLSSNTLHVSDIVRLIMGMGVGTDIQAREVEENRPVISVTNVSLSLFLDNRSITTGARDCLQLLDNARYIAQLSLEKCSITVTRNNSVVSYNLNKVLDRYYKLINAANFTHAIPSDAPSDIPPPVGEPLALGGYYSIQNDLPLCYGVGKARLPASTSPQRLGQAKQLQGYLFSFEQVLSGYFSQLAHVNALFSAQPSVTTTLYQLPLYDIPAAPDLLLPLSGHTNWQDFIEDTENPYIDVLETGPETEDQFLTRRHQMLDHLLGRLGEDLRSFSSLIYRQSYSNPTSFSTSASGALLQLKADYYYALPELEKNRAQAYGHPAWRNKELMVTSPSPDGHFFLWQVRDDDGSIIFRQAVPETTKTSAEEMAEAVFTLGTSSLNYFVESDLTGLQRVGLRWSADESAVAVSSNTYASVIEAENDIPVLRQRMLNLWIKYSLSSLEIRLQHLLGIANNGVRQQLVTPTATEEGFYMVEHVLLHSEAAGDTVLEFSGSVSSCLPVSPSGSPYALPNDAYSFILTIIFPSGYSRDFSDNGAIPIKQESQPERFRDPEFKQYAEQTIRKFCPAHILPLVVWIDTASSGTELVDGLGRLYPCFDNFESTYMAWLAAFFTDEVPSSQIGPARNALVNVMNAVFSEPN